MTDKKTTEADDNKDPYEDGVPRSFPRSEDNLGTPDTQPDQPAGALGVHQVSMDSVQQENEKFADLAADHGGKDGELMRLSEEDKLKARKEIKDGSMIEGGHPDAQQEHLDEELDRAKDRDKAAKPAPELESTSEEENDTAKTSDKRTETRAAAKK